MGRLGCLFDEERSQKVADLCERLHIEPYELLSSAIDKMAEAYKDRETPDA